MAPNRSKILQAYTVLGLEEGCSLEVVKSTYKQIALRTHPDKNPNDPDATAQFQRVGEAYNALLKHLDTTSGNDSDEYDYGFFDDDDFDPREQDFYFYMFLFEEFMANRGSRYSQARYRRQHTGPPESPQAYQERLRRQREEQLAAAERRKRESAARKLRNEQDRERERFAAEERQRAKVEEKRAQAEAQRRKGEQAALKQQQKAQVNRSSVFTAARAGDAAQVKKGVWEDDVDAAGGEVKRDCERFVLPPPKDPRETLLHIAARNGDTDLVEWLDAHNADAEEQDSQGFTAFHVAVQSGHVPVLTYFIEAYSPKDLESTAIYRSSSNASSSLMLALESADPEVVWIILDNGLASDQDINEAWAWITTAVGRETVLQKQRKNGHQDTEKFDDIMKLLMRFGGFTPPPTPQLGRNDDESNFQLSEPSPLPHSQSKPQKQKQKQKHRPAPPRSPVEQSSPADNIAVNPELPAPQEPRSTQNRGRGRGGGRGRGRGRGKGAANASS